MIRFLITALVVTVSALVSVHGAGETITLDLPDLPAGKTLTLEYDTIVQSLGGDTSDLSTRATITADGGLSVETSDPTTPTPAPNDPTLTAVFENAPPTAGGVIAGNVGAAEEGFTSYSFTIDYSDDGTVTNVDVSTIDVADVTVTGPGALGELAVTAGSEPSGTAGTPRTAIYTVTPPGGTWDAGDNGTYTIAMVASQVSDIGSGPPLSVVAGTLATFDVNVPDPSYTIVADDADKLEGNAGTTAFTFTVSRGGDTSVAGSVDYTVTGADAADFSSPLAGTIPFPSAASSVPLSVQVVGDSDVEGDEGFTVSLSNPMPSPGTVIGTPASAGGTIRNDDASLAIAAIDASKAEGDAGTTGFTFTVTRSGYLDVAASVDFAVTGSGGDPADAADFAGALPSGTINFASSEASQGIMVDVSGDTDLEADEGFTVTLSNPSGAGIGTATDNGSITNDDALTVEIAANDPDADENTPDAGNFRITRNSSDGPLEVQIALDPASTATPADDFSLGGVMLAGAAGSVTIPDGSTFIDIPLTPADDVPAEASETAILEVTADPGYLLGASISGTVTIAANDFVVTNASDFDPGTAANGGEGTLRQAILNANAIGGLPTISFSDTDGTPFSTAPQTINLTGGELLLTEAANLDGPVLPGRVTINAGGLSRVMWIQSTAAPSTLSRLTITGGQTTPVIGGGGIRILNADTTLSDCLVDGNNAGFGGGVHLEGAILHVTNSTIRGNLSTSTVRGGGGVYCGANSTLRLRGSTIALNESGQVGGGIASGGADLFLVNSTISGNRAVVDGGGLAILGGGRSVVLDHVTISDNHSNINLSGPLTDMGGGGVWAPVPFFPFDVNHSIVAGNIRDGVGPSDFKGRIDTTVSYYNLIGIDTGIIAVPVPLDATNQVGSLAGPGPLDPMLEALGDNGGPTWTHALMPGSPALDAGDPAFNPADFTPPLDFDQRGPGFSRVFNGTIDIGAFELPNVPPAVAADNPMVMGPEGSEATNTGTFSDTAGDTVTISADIGTVMQTGTDSGTWSWSYTPTNGPTMEAVTITATDSFMKETTTTFDLDVKNANPTLLLDPVAAIDENGVATLTGTISDPGIPDTFTLDINWGDPLSPNNTEMFNFPASATGSQTFTLTHHYLDDNPTATAQDSYSVSGTVTDNDTGSGMGGTSVIVRDVAPVVELDPIFDINEDGTITLTGTITDPGTLDTLTLDIDWGDPLSPNNTEPFMFPPSATGSQTFSISHHYLDDNPSGTARDDYIVQATVTDDDTLGSADSESFMISNVRPDITLDPVMAIDENGWATLTGTITDPGTLDTFRLFVDWGDALNPDNFENFTFGSSATGTQSFTLTHQYLDDNPSGTPQDSKLIFALLLDDEGASDFALAAVQINNVAPEITQVSANPTPGGVTVDVDFTDPGTPDTHTAQILWGDGSSTPLTLAVGDRSFQASHSYAMEPPPGGYPVTVIVTDDDTGSDSETTGPPAPPDGQSEIDEVVRLPNGDVQIGFSAMPGEEFQIEVSEDLVHWNVAEVSIIATGNRVQWTDPNPGPVPRRFYRFVRVGGPPPP